MFEPVSHRGVQQGTLYLAAASGGLRVRVSEATTTVLLSGLTAILVAAVLAWLLQRSLTRPILRLAETMGRINDPTMISPRVSHVSRDEIGVLYRGFYRMLDQLAAGEQERDRSGARLRALIAALPDPVFVLEDNGNIAEVLAGRPEALTLPAAELRGRPITGRDRHRARGELRARHHAPRSPPARPSGWPTSWTWPTASAGSTPSWCPSPSTRTRAGASGWCCSCRAT